MTRRALLGLAAAPACAAALPAPLVVPVHRVMDARAQCTPAQFERFWRNVWPEAVRTFSRGGIALQTSDVQGVVRRSPGDQPIIEGVRRGAINLVLTGHIPMKWDSGRALAGVTTIYDGYHLCMIALRYAHGNQVPFISLNTCVHELLHALLGDVYVRRPSWYQGGERESRTDWYATTLWLFGGGASIRASARTYLDRLRAESTTAALSTLPPFPPC
jgi:hypothetical protein